MRGCSLRHWVPGYPLQQALSAVVEGLDPPACAEMPGHRPVASLAQGSGRGGGAQAESFTRLAEQLRASAQEQSEGPAQRGPECSLWPSGCPSWGSSQSPDRLLDRDCSPSRCNVRAS